MISLVKYTLGWMAVVILLTIAFLYYEFNPAEHVFFPPCIFLKVTGMYCPGCGAQRALHQLMHGNFRQAFRYNALLILLLPYVSLGLVLHLWTQTRGFASNRFLTTYYGPKVLLGILVLVCLFWIFRNIPVSPFIWLAPGS